MSFTEITVTGGQIETAINTPAFHSYYVRFLWVLSVLETKEVHNSTKRYHRGFLFLEI